MTILAVWIIDQRSFAQEARDATILSHEARIVFTFSGCGPKMTERVQIHAVLAIAIAISIAVGLAIIVLILFLILSDDKRKSRPER